MTHKKKDVLRFWGKVQKQRSCWLWTAGKDGGGYGLFFIEGKRNGAHRFSLEIKLKRRLISGEFALHKCDIKNCVNPDHLFVGTSADNSQDMVNKQRGMDGSKNHFSVLTEKDVLRIRKQYATRQFSLTQLAEQHHVALATIHLIVTGVTWRNVGGPLSIKENRYIIGQKLRRS